MCELARSRSLVLPFLLWLSSQLTEEPNRKEACKDTSEHRVAERDRKEPEKGKDRRDEEGRVDDRVPAPESILRSYVDSRDYPESVLGRWGKKEGGGEEEREGNGTSS